MDACEQGLSRQPGRVPLCRLQSARQDRPQRSHRSHRASQRRPGAVLGSVELGWPVLVASFGEVARGCRRQAAPCSRVRCLGHAQRFRAPLAPGQPGMTAELFPTISRRRARDIAGARAVLSAQRSGYPPAGAAASRASVETRAQPPLRARCRSLGRGGSKIWQLRHRERRRSAETLILHKKAF